MQRSETILLLMPDAVRRAACFTALATAPQRIIRGYGCADDVCEVLAGTDQACLVIDQAAIRQPGFGTMTGLLEDHPAIFPLVLAPALDADDAMTLLSCPRCDILRERDDVGAIADRVAVLLPLAAQVGTRWRRERDARAALARLSPRETSVLTGLAEGQTSKDIARALGVSPRTIEVHRASIMRRTGAATLAELLRLCFLAELSVPPAYARAA
jgi:two-component system, LuxR family, response regulator FixJ